MRWPVILVVVAALGACHPPPRPKHWKKQPHVAALTLAAPTAPPASASDRPPVYQTTP